FSRTTKRRCSMSGLYGKHKLPSTHKLNKKIHSKLINRFMQIMDIIHIGHQKQLSFGINALHIYVGVNIIGLQNQ
ncbi:MAG: hypothetical protein MJK06_16450, partial [Hyphomicrobiales bacterium]|nr:hypothetical protein [Hyphomicrobiales bacterium]